MLCIIIDSMDQWKTSIPCYFSKEESDKFKIRLTGVICHGLLNPFFIFINQHYTGETNTNIHCIISVLDQVSFFSFSFFPCFLHI